MNFPVYAYVAILLLVGLLSTRVMKKLKLPNVTGYIVTGIIMGPFVFGLFFNNFTYAGIKESTIYQNIKQISWVSTIALGFIAFSIGTSFKKSALKSVGSKVLIVTAAEALGGSLLVTIALVIGHYISPNTISLEVALTLGAIASATAPAATLMVIKQYKAKGKLVDTLLPVVALDDAAALILFAILFQIATSIATGGSFDPYKMFAKPIIEIVLSLGIGAILGFAISFLNKLFHSRNNKLVLAIFTVFMATGLNVLFKNEWMGSFELSSLLTCMVAGAIYVNFAKNNETTLDQLDRFTYPIYMMFFVISGASLDLTVFANGDGLIVLIVALIYVITRVIGKYAGAYTSTSLLHYDKNVRDNLGFTLVPQAGVAIGLATTASTLFGSSTLESVQRSGTLILAIILTSTLIYELIGPFVSKWALKRSGDITEE